MEAGVPGMYLLAESPEGRGRAEGRAPQAPFSKSVLRLHSNEQFSVSKRIYTPHTQSRDKLSTSLYYSLLQPTYFTGENLFSSWKIQKYSHSIRQPGCYATKSKFELQNIKVIFNYYRKNTRWYQKIKIQ
jgi:hypothetical protein